MYIEITNDLNQTQLISDLIKTIKTDEYPDYKIEDSELIFLADQMGKLWLINE